MINVQVKANSIMHSEFGTRFSRDNQLVPQPVSAGINPCATKQSALCLVGAGLVSARFRKSPVAIRVPTRGTLLDNWTLDIDCWIFNSSLSASGGFSLTTQPFFNFLKRFGNIVAGLGR